MEYLALISLLIVIGLLIYIEIQRIKIRLIKGKFIYALCILQQIKRKLYKMAPFETQAEFDAEILRATTDLDTIATKITDEATEIQTFIDGHPNVDTSALAGVVNRLGTVGDAVSGIFTPPTPPADPNA